MSPKLIVIKYNWIHRHFVLEELGRVYQPTYSFMYLLSVSISCCCEGSHSLLEFILVSGFLLLVSKSSCLHRTIVLKSCHKIQTVNKVHRVQKCVWNSAYFIVPFILFYLLYCPIGKLTQLITIIVRIHYSRAWNCGEKISAAILCFPLLLGHTQWCLGFTDDSALRIHYWLSQGTNWDARDIAQVGCLQGKHLICCNISLVLL